MERNFSTEKVKPFVLEYSEAKNEVFTAVNDAVSKHGIPMYFMESILLEAISQVKEAAQKEISDAKTAYENYLAEEHPRDAKGE